MPNNNSNELTLLHLAKLGITNTKNKQEIADSLALFGYTAEEIAKGEEILTTAQKEWADNRRENDEAKEAFHTFAQKREILQKQYASDRKRAKVIFRNDSMVKERLQISGTLSKAFLPFLATSEKLYTELKASETLLTQLARMQFTPELVDERLALIAEVKNLHADYYKEKGDSEEATRIKDKSLAALEEWMIDFHATAKIALEETPQYLESLGIVAR